MTFFEMLESRITTIDKKTWYTYLAITAGVIFTLIAAILFFYFRSIWHSEQRIGNINETRIEAKRILNKADRVQKERATITALLEEDPNFKIKAYVQETLENVGISYQNNVSAENVVTTTGDDNYVVDIATYQLTGLTMKQLTEFLDALENNKRVFIKELDISKSKKIPRTIDVGITIATMMPKET